MSFGILILASALLAGCVIECGQVGPNNLWYSEHIVPDVLSYVPKVNATMRFDTGAVVVTGEFLSIQQVSSQLTSIDFAFIPTGLYTIVMLDLDSPSAQHPTDGQYVQWLIVNVGGNSGLNGNLGSGDLVQRYQNPNPASGTGIHRYLFLVFLQSGLIDIQVTIERPHFNVEKFAEQYVIGQAVCGNFILVKT